MSTSCIYINFLLKTRLEFEPYIDYLEHYMVAIARCYFTFDQWSNKIEMMVIMMSFVMWPDELPGGHRVDDPQHVTSSFSCTWKCGEIVAHTKLYGNTVYLVEKACLDELEQKGNFIEGEQNHEATITKYRYLIFFMSPIDFVGTGYINNWRNNCPTI